jgi:ferredoxin
MNLMALPLWVVQFLRKCFPSRFRFAKFTHVPLLGKVIDRMVFHEDITVYLPKNKTIQINTSFDPPESQPLPSEVLDHFIEEANYHWIMNFCICRLSTDCQDYPIKLGCLFLGESILDINSHLGRRVTKEEAHEHILKCQEAGLVHLIGRNRIDSLWLNVDGKKLMTICNCCPCCCLWKMLPQLSPMIGDKVTKMNGISVSVTDDCTGCGTCTEDICFVDAISLVNGKSVISSECRGCGRCVEVCPSDAIVITIDDEFYVQETIDRIDPYVLLK